MQLFSCVENDAPAHSCEYGALRIDRPLLASQYLGDVSRGGNNCCVGHTHKYNFERFRGTLILLESFEAITGCNEFLFAFLHEPAKYLKSHQHQSHEECRVLTFRLVTLSSTNRTLDLLGMLVSGDCFISLVLEDGW
jgi:hypothetical protein